MTPAERKAAQRARNREAGLIKFEVNIPDTEAAREAVAALARGLSMAK